MGKPINPCAASAARAITAEDARNPSPDPRLRHRPASPPRLRQRRASPKLTHQGYAEDLVTEAVEELVAEGVLNDTRYLEELRQLPRRPRRRSLRIESELQQFGIPPTSSRPPSTAAPTGKPAPATSASAASAPKSPTPGPRRPSRPASSSTGLHLRPDPRRPRPRLRTRVVEAERASAQRDLIRRRHVVSVGHRQPPLHRRVIPVALHHS